MKLRNCTLIVSLFLVMLAPICCSTAQAASISIVPSKTHAMPGEDFYFDVVVSDIPSEGLGTVQFRLKLSAPGGGTIAGVIDLGQAAAQEIAVSSPLLATSATTTKSRLGDFFLGGVRNDSPILFLDNEQIHKTDTGGTGLYTFAHTSGAVLPSGNGSVARFMVRVGAGVTADCLDISLNDVLLLDGGPIYSLDYNVGASVSFRTLSLTPGTLPTADYNQQYSQILSASGGVAPYSYSIVEASGSLPVGLTLSSTGVISGAATVNDQISTFILRATDVNGATGEQSYTINVTTPPLTITTTNLSPGMVGISYSQQMVGDYGQTPYIWTATNFPDGLSISSNGLISGTPATVESKIVTILLTDASGVTVTKDLTLDVYSSLVISTDNISCTSGVACNQPMLATGGKPSYSWSIISGNLPEGLSLNGEGVISGVSAEVVNSMLMVQVTDVNGTVASKSLDFTNYLSVSGYQPASGANVSSNTNIQANFSAPLDPVTVTAGNFSLSFLRSIATGGYHSLALKSDGAVVAWGLNNYGQSTVPAGLSGVIAIAAGDLHSIALKSDGTVVAWGLNNCGQSTVPVGLSGVIAIEAGEYHSVALKSDGTVVAWGSNENGQSTVPEGLSGVIAITAGLVHTVALKSDGTVVAWGSNFDGQSTVPVGLSGVTAIAAGSNHSVALNSDGTVVTWGLSSLGGAGQTYAPNGLAGVVAISSGGFHTMALKKDGTVVAWGTQVFGYNGEVWGYDYDHVPEGLPDVMAISSGGHHTLALKKDGTVVAWGNNDYGQTTVPEELGSDGIVVSGALSYNATTQTATFAQTDPLRGGATYYATITGVTSESGVPLSAPFTWSFRAHNILIVYPATLLTGIIGTEYSQTLQAVYGDGHYSWSIIAGALPAGLNLDGATGNIHGSPTLAGSATFTIQVIDGGNNIATQDLTINVVEPLIITIPGMPVAAVGGQQFHVPLTAIGGTPPYTWSAISGELPPGLNLTNTYDPFDGPCQSIFGYTEGVARQYNFTLQVTDSSNLAQTATTNFQINVYEPVNITTDLPGTVVAMPYSKGLQVAGGVPPYTLSFQPYDMYPYIGMLPPGLSFNSSTGIIDGTPTAAGNYAFIISAVDSVGITGSRLYYLSISNPISISTASLPVGVVDMPFINRNDPSNPDFYMQSEGGTSCDAEWCNPRNTWSIVGGALPSGINLDSASGRLSGTPTVSGIFDITFRVTDPGSGSEADKPLQLVINPVEILDSGLAAGTLNKPYADTLTAGGPSPLTWTSSNLPPGITLNSATGVLSGIPTETGYFKPRITVTDANQNSAYKDLELSVNDLDVQWERTVTGDGTRGKRVLTDSAGNIYTLGTAYNAAIGNNDVILTKYSAEGSQSGSTITIDDGDDEAVDMVIDSSNNIFVLSQYYDLNTGVSDHKIYKYASDGSSWTSTGSPGTSADAFAVDSQGNSFVVSEFYTGSNWGEIVYKYDANGARVTDWEATYNYGDDDPKGIAVDNSGNVYVVASTSTAEGSSFLTIKFGPNGQLDTNWPRVHKSTDSTNENPNAITVDGNNNVYVTGNIYNENSGERRAKTIKYDADGNLSWLNIYSRMYGADRPQGLSLDGKGNLYVVGNSYYKTRGNQESLIIKYDANTTDPEGKITWTKSYDFQGASDDRANCVAIDQNDNLLITGEAWNTTAETDQMTTVKFYRTDLTITTDSLPSGVVGNQYNQQLSSKYGLAPYTWSVIEGGLPVGLILDVDTGVISGSPTSSGISNFRVQVLDSKGDMATRPYSITISLL